MKYLVKIFVITCLLFISTYAHAEEKISYIDMKFVLNNSQAGKGAQDFLKKTFTERQKYFLDTENKLKKQEKDLLSKKTTLSKEDYIKKSDELRKSVIKYQKERRETLDKIAKQRSESRQKLLEKIDPIVKKYMDENDISLIIDKKNLLAGKSDLDLTDIIIQKLNKELPSLNLK